MLQRVRQFFQTDLWRLRLHNYSRSKSFLLRLLRIVVLAVQGFDEDLCQLRASALTYYTLLSMVPVLAMMFGVAKGFDLEKRVQALLLERTQGQEAVVRQMIDFANSLLTTTRGGIIAGVGVAVLFYTVVKVLTNIEASFNHIWGVQKGRSLGRRFSDYLAVMLICPVFLVMSSSLTVVVSTQVSDMIERVRLLHSLGFFLRLGLKLLPYAIVWFTFSFVYVLIPNTRVRWRSGLLAGVVAGTLFQLVQWVYVTFQIGAANYGAIYGSFAALPLFLAWLQLSWLVVLFGAELTFAHQNVETYEFEPDGLNISQSLKTRLSLLVAHHLVRRFCTGEKPAGPADVSHTLDIPVRLVRQILFELAESGILSEVRPNDDRTVIYQPAQDTSRLTIKYVLDALQERGNTALSVIDSAELRQINACLHAFSAALEASPANVSLKDL